MRNRIRALTICGPLLAGFATIWIGVMAGPGEAAPAPSLPSTQDDATASYVGIRGCKKCHQKSAIGKQYKVWQKRGHAKAFEQLKSEESVALAAKLGVEKKPWEAPECLKCHTTGYGLPETRFGEKFKLEDGVSCEVCHGPSEFYDKPEDGKIHKEAFGKGYITPDEKLCRTCHNEDSPTWDPERDTTKDGKKVGFDFEARWKQILHPIPEEEGGE